MLIPIRGNGDVQGRRLYFKGGDGGASDMRKMEEERQARIDAAVKAINDIFDPQPYVTADLENKVTSYDPSQTYYLADGSVFDPMSTRTEPYTYTVRSGGAKPFEQNRTKVTGTRTVSYLDWDKINNAIQSGSLYGSKTVVPDSREKLYEEQRDAVYDINAKEVNDQYADAERANRFGLARNGLLGGSADVDSNARLQEITNEGLLQAGGIADSAAAKLRAQDESARQSLISMAQSGIDTGTAQQMAIESLNTTAQQAQGERAGASVGDLFGTLGQAYLRYNKITNGNGLFSGDGVGSNNMSTRSTYQGSTD